MPDSRRDQLRAELMRLRLRAGLGGRPLGKELDITQATVSRIERGTTLPSLPVVDRWLVVCGADDDTADRVRAMAEGLHAVTRGWSDLLDADGHAQREFAAREATSTWIRNFQPTVVPGLLQTPEYARAVLELGRTRDVEGAVAERMTRQRRLYEPGRRFSFLLAEQVLHWPVGGPEVLEAQRDRLVSLARLASVDLAVLPQHRVVRALWNNFVIWRPSDGSTFAATELFTGEFRPSDQEDVDLLTSVWDELRAAALSGDEAIELIRGRR